MGSVIGNGNFEKAPEIVVESNDAKEVKAKPKWKRPGTSAAEPKTKGPGTKTTNKLGENVTNPKTTSAAPKKESNDEVQQKKDLPKPQPAVTSKKETKNKTSVDPKQTSVSNEINLGKKPEESNDQSDEIKETKPKPKWKRPGVDSAA